MSLCNVDPCAPPLYPDRFPEEISYGSKGGPKFKTSILTSMAGIEVRRVNWAQLRCEYEVKSAIRTPKQAEDLKNFFMCKRGKSRSFRFKDWNDFTIQNQFWFVGNGITSVIQLWKTYVSGVEVYYRQITRPVKGTFLIVADSGVTWSELGSPASDLPGAHNFSVDDTTGLVTFDPTPNEGVTFTIVYAEFDVHCRFDTDKMVMNQDYWRTSSWETIPIVELYDTPQIAYGQPGMMPFNVAAYDDAAGTSSTNPGPGDTDLPATSTASQTTLPLIAFEREVPSTDGRGTDRVTIMMDPISLLVPADPLTAGYKARYIGGTATDYVAMCWLVYCEMTGAADDGLGNPIPDAMLPYLRRLDGIAFGPSGVLTSTSGYSISSGGIYITLYYLFPTQAQFQALRRGFYLGTLSTPDYVLYCLLAQGNNPTSFGMPQITSFANNNPGAFLIPSY